MLVFFDWPLPHVCTLQIIQPILILILGSVFSDCVVFYGDNTRGRPSTRFDDHTNTPVNGHSPWTFPPGTFPRHSRATGYVRSATAALNAREPIN